MQVANFKMQWDSETQRYLQILKSIFGFKQSFGKVTEQKKVVKS